MSNLLEQLDAEIDWTEKRLEVLRKARVILAQDEPAPHRMPRIPRSRKVSAPRKSMKPSPNLTASSVFCPTCKQTKPAEDFAANRSRPNGLQSQCRACNRAAVAKSAAKRKRDIKPAKSPKAEEPEPVRACATCGSETPVSELRPVRGKDRRGSYCPSCWRRLNLEHQHARRQRIRNGEQVVRHRAKAIENQARPLVGVSRARAVAAAVTAPDVATDADLEAFDLEVDARPSRATPHQRAELPASPRARRVVLAARAAAAKNRRRLRCKIDGCGAEVESHKAGQHAWEAHHRALPAGDLALFEDLGAAA